jgi:hypothetical protein
VIEDRGHREPNARMRQRSCRVRPRPDLIDESAKPGGAVRCSPTGPSAASRAAVHLTAQDGEATPSATARRGPFLRPHAGVVPVTAGWAATAARRAKPVGAAGRRQRPGRRRRAAPPLEEVEKISKNAAAGRRAGHDASMDVQRQRARQYAVCSFALAQDRITDGAEGVFDQALTNGLAAIVAAEWAGAEVGKEGRVRSASGLLRVIEERASVADGGVVRLLKKEGAPEWIPSVFDDGLIPNFTAVEVVTFRDALRVTQAIRHARDVGMDVQTGLTEQHIKALGELAYHPALFVVSNEAIDRAEARADLADNVETERAAGYLATLGDEERARREAIDYEEEYGFATRDERCEVEECPVCMNVALVAYRFDGWLDEIGIGTCVVCSYDRSAEVADELATSRMLDRHQDD